MSHPEQKSDDNERIEKKMRDTGKSVARTGITFGSALAIAISWSLHKSILWACIHGFFSWFYVIYYAFTR